MSTDKTVEIAALNDRLRQTFSGGQVLITNGIESLAPHIVQRIVEAVRSYDSFAPDNDPYGEHDFGVVDISGAPKVFWKIDYYDSDLRCGSEDPSDPDVTQRVLTIFLASEY